MNFYALHDMAQRAKGTMVESSDGRMTDRIQVYAHGNQINVVKEFDMGKNRSPLMSGAAITFDMSPVDHEATVYVINGSGNADYDHPIRMHMAHAVETLPANNMFTAVGWREITKSLQLLQRVE